MRKQQKYPIIWKQEIVGAIDDLESDNFDVYGKWLPGNGLITQQFLKEIVEKGEVVVRIGMGEPKWLGTVEKVPENEIEIKSRPNLLNE